MERRTRAAARQGRGRERWCVGVGVGVGGVRQQRHVCQGHVSQDAFARKKKPPFWAREAGRPCMTMYRRTHKKEKKKKKEKTFLGARGRSAMRMTMYRRTRSRWIRFKSSRRGGIASPGFQPSSSLCVCVCVCVCVCGIRIVLHYMRVCVCVSVCVCGIRIVLQFMRVLRVHPTSCPGRK